VKDELKGNDGSHDFHHINRVRKLALSLAEEEHIENTDVVELAALLHDIKDWKYSGSETAGIDAARQFLQIQHVPEDKIALIVKAIEGVGFKTELGKKLEMFPELAVVQDADRLDAIGAIGIARTFTYGGAKNRPIYDPSVPPQKDLTKEQYMAQNKNAPTVNHFYEKLLKLKGLMKTEAGRRRAEQRHAFMEQFLERIFAECDGTA